MASDVTAVGLAPTPRPARAAARGVGCESAAPPASASLRGLAWRSALALGSAGVLTLSFPAPDLGFLGWIALAPLLFAIRDLRPIAAGALGWVSGALAAVGIHHWILTVDGVGGLQVGLLAALLGGYSAAWCAGVAVLSRSRVPLMVTAPSLWVALDYARAHAGFLAFPWATLAQSQHENLWLLQLAGIAGEPGVTFVVATGSVAAFSLGCLLSSRIGNSRSSASLGSWTRDRSVPRAGAAPSVAAALLALAAIVVVHAWGALAIARTTPGRALRLALVQPAFPFGEERTPEVLLARTARLEELTREVASSAPALIAWPETAVRQLGREPALSERLQTLAAGLDASLLVGSSEADKFRSPDGAAEFRSHNTAYHVVPGRPLEPPYQKMLLVPFAERVPLQSIVDWPRWLAPPGFDVTPGQVQHGFRLRDGTPFAVVICWENLFADFVRSATADGARFLVHITNDNWFGGSAASRQHLLASVLRAVENRVPVVVASNTGPSQLIDGTGAVRAELPELLAPGALAAQLPLGNGGTLYSRFGDWFVAGTLATLGVALWLRRKDGRDGAGMVFREQRRTGK